MAGNLPGTVTIDFLVVSSFRVVMHVNFQAEVHSLLKQKWRDAVQCTMILPHAHHKDPFVLFSPIPTIIIQTVQSVLFIINFKTYTTWNLITILPTIHYYSSHLLEHSTQRIWKENSKCSFMNTTLRNNSHHNLELHNHGLFLKSNGMTHP